jgi:hypothetical protein
MGASTAIRSRSIIMTGESVRAILDGRKTQTRRVVKLPHQNPLGNWEPTTVGGEDGGRTKDGDTVPEQGAIWHTRTGDCIACPLGMPGSHLWVRETWSRIEAGRYCPIGGDVVYRAAGERRSGAQAFRWHSPIHMPRWASRLMLEITEIRVERLQDISKADAVAEGAPHPSQIPGGISYYDGKNFRDVTTVREVFRCSWNAINWKRAPWDSNPWVWVIGFKPSEVSS